MIKKILGDYGPMLDTIFAKLNDLKVDGITLCDHICYRVETIEKYEEIKGELSSFSKLIGETLVSKRLISIFKLDEPIVYKNYTITCIELPAPKENSFYSEGWEHAEFVIENLNEFIIKHDHLGFNKKAMGRDINPELGLKINESFQVKFHPLHIEEVIAIESKLGIKSV